MKTNWDLSVFYKSFDDPAFAADLAALPGRIDALTAMIDAPADDETAKLRGIVEAFEALNEASEPLYMMVMLTLSTDAQNPAANAAQTPLNRAGMAFAQMESRLSRYLASLDNLDALIEGDEVLRARGFALREYAETARHQIDPALEGPVLKMQLSGGKQFSELRGKLDATVLVDYRGITVADDTKLRRELREAGVEYAVIKNNILRRAAEEAGLGELTAHMYGTSAFAYSPEDPIAAAKILNKFAESHKDKFDIRAGYMDGKVLDEAGVIAVAKLPGKQELLTMLCMALNGNIRGLAVALDAVREKKEGEAA